MDSQSYLPPPSDARTAPESAPPLFAELPARDGPAWEWRADLGAWPALRMTVKEVLATPREAFVRMRNTGGYGEPFRFYLIMRLAVGFAAFWISLPARLRGEAEMRNLAMQNWGAVQQLLDMMKSAEFEKILRAKLTEPTSVTAAFIQWAAGFPVSLIAGLVFSVLLAHGCLMLMRGARGGLETTFRAFVYSAGATCVLRLIPLIGAPIETLIVWPIVFIIALSAAHETSAARATAAVLLPGLVLIVLGMAALVAGLALLRGVGAGLM